MTDVSPYANPDALYAGVVGEIQSQPDIRAELSEFSHAILSTAESIVENAAKGAATEISNALLSEAASVVGWDAVDLVAGVASEVASAIASVLPALSAGVNVIESAVGQIDAYQKAWKQHQSELVAAVLRRPLIGSGYAGAIMPADIFAYEPDWIPGSPVTTPAIEQGYPFIPTSALGIVLAAITEDSRFDWTPFGKPPFSGIVDENGERTTLDSNLHHADSVLLHSFGGGFGIGNVTKKSARRRVYQLLRRAIGSRNHDQGLALWPIYMDLLAADWTPRAKADAINLLTHVIADNRDDGRFAKSMAEQSLQSTDPASVQGNALVNLVRVALVWSPGEVRPFVEQIERIVIDWRSTRVSLKAHAPAIATTRSKVMFDPNHGITTSPASSSAATTVAPSSTLSIWTRIRLWLADAWRYFKSIFTSSSSHSVQGVGLLVADEYPTGPSDGRWMILSTSSGDSTPITDAEANAAMDAAGRIIPPPPVFHPGVPRTVQHYEAAPAFVLCDEQGIGISLSRAQGVAAANAIALLNAAHAAIADESMRLLESPLDELPPARVPYHGGFVDVGEEHFAEAIVFLADGGEPGEHSDPRVDAAIGVLATASDPDTVADVHALASQGHVLASLTTLAMVHADRARARLTALELADGALSGDPDALELAENAVFAAQAGDPIAHAMVRAMNDALYAFAPEG